MTSIASSPRARPFVALVLIATVTAGALADIVSTPPAAKAANAGSPGETAASGCPPSNPPNQLTLVAGTPQTSTLETAFPTGLQVALTNSDGCPVTSNAAGVTVTFSAPSSGPSGVFASSGSSVVAVGTDASGAALAPAFTADARPGTYTLNAGSRYGSVSFSLTNTAAGIPASITATTPKNSSANVGGRYPGSLQVRVLDAGGNAVAGVSVTFALGSGAPSACGTSTNASASFIGSGAQSSQTTSETGLASSPPLIANGEAGWVTATAAISGSPGGAGTALGPVTPVSFSLRNRAGLPIRLTAGLGATQTAPAGATFPIRLAVTATDAEKNRVPGALVTFSAPTHAAGGHFAHSRDPHRVRVRTDACGVAVAPSFTADHQAGGYVVKAALPRLRPAAFALVNTAPVRAG